MRALRHAHRILPVLAALAPILWLAAAIAAGAQESQSYRMDRLTVVSGGTMAASPNYTMRVTFGQESPAAIDQDPAYIGQA